MGREPWFQCAELSRAIGLAQSIEHPVGVDLPLGTRAVASQIVAILERCREALRAESSHSQPGGAE